MLTNWCQIIVVVLYVADGSYYTTSPTLPFDDYLPHTALQKVPTKLGEDVQLRCTKIIERMESDYIETTFSCDPFWSKNCYHVWSKDGEILDDKNWKYDTKSIITFDYCENFEWTTDLIKGFGPIVDVNSGKEDYYSNREMACYASALTIRNVTGADFGEYKCNLSDHKGHKGGDNYYRNGVSSVQNITLYNINDATIKQPEKVEYFEKYYTKGLKEKILVQCVTTGGELKWYVDIYHYGNEECHDEYYGANCFRNSSIPLEELNSQDFWRCFNYSEDSHSPHKGITESFVYFDKICALDYGRISCSVGDIGPKDEKNYSAYIQMKTFWYDYDNYWYGENWERDQAMAIAGFTVVPVIVASLIIFGIVAMVRSKMCECCRPRSVAPTMLHYQPQPPYPAPPV